MTSTAAGLLLGHVASHHRVVRAAQRLLEKKSVPIAGDCQTRVPTLVAIGFRIERQARSRAGVIQRIVAVKPAKQ